MRCKMRLDKVSKTVAGWTIEMSPVTASSPENETFFKWTPFGSLTLGIINPTVVEGLEPGSEFYLDFTEAKKVS